MQTLVPIGSFEQRARQLLNEREFDAMLHFIATRPRAGRIIEGTGGLRKVRIARGSAGKSSGVRVIYYYHSENSPILLLLIYPKASQGNLTARQKLQLKKSVGELTGDFG